MRLMKQEYFAPKTEMLELDPEYKLMETASPGGSQGENMNPGTGSW